jgi:hypothetical protein
MEPQNNKEDLNKCSVSEFLANNNNDDEFIIHFNSDDDSSDVSGPDQGDGGKPLSQHKYHNQPWKSARILTLITFQTVMKMTVLETKTMIPMTVATRYLSLKKKNKLWIWIGLSMISIKNNVIAGICSTD